MKSKIDHRSPRWFSTGVPVSAMRALGLQRLGRPGLLGVRVLDRLRLVEDRRSARRVSRQHRQAQQRAVAGDHQVESRRAVRA